MVNRIVALGVVFLLMGSLLCSHQTCGQNDDERPTNTASVESDRQWGRASGGLRMRVVVIDPKSDEQDVALVPFDGDFASDDELTLGVEIQNVSEKAIKLQGTRYGDSITPPWPGKSVSNRFAPLLFECDFGTVAGNVVKRVTRHMDASDLSMMLSSGSVETVEPGEAIRILLRPAKWEQSLGYELPAGEYRVRVRYRGPFDEARKLVGNRWAGHQVADAWTGEVESREVDLRIAEDPFFEPATLSWGDPIDGLSAAVEFLAKRSATDPIHRPVTKKSAVPLSSKVQVRLHIKNVSDKTITFWSETWRQDDRVIVNDGSGEQRDLPQTWYSGWSSMIHWTLQPGQVAKLDAIQLGVAADEESAREFDHPIGPKIIGPAGFYAVRYTLRFGGMQRKDAKGIVIIPGPGDWTGTLTTDWTPLKVRERTPKDERPTFTARLQFRSAEQKVIKTGKVTVRLQSRGTGLFEGEVQSGLLTVGQCPYDEPLIVQVRSPGFEETSFYDVAVRASEITSLTVPKADPVRFRLVSRAGQPVVGAKVRLFNRSKKAASVGPYPMKGLQGPVWGTSDEDGIVVLDMLQLIDPNDNKLGNNLYFFYIEPLKLAPRFLGPLEAGDQPGDLEIGPWLEARGEIRGTEEELKNFAAEWDQPEPMVKGDGTVGWYYAQSKRLETTRVGDKLTFHLKDLRPGRLRIVSNFRADTKSTRHVYSRREPTEGDVVFDVNLQNSRNDLVVTNRFVREQ